MCHGFLRTAGLLLQPAPQGHLLVTNGCRGLSVWKGGQPTLQLQIQCPHSCWQTNSVYPAATLRLVPPLGSIDDRMVNLSGVLDKSMHQNQCSPAKLSFTQATNSVTTVSPGDRAAGEVHEPRGTAEEGPRHRASEATFRAIKNFKSFCVTVSQTSCQTVAGGSLVKIQTCCGNQRFA